MPERLAHGRKPETPHSQEDAFVAGALRLWRWLHENLRSAILITGARIHPLSPADWMIEVRGGILDEGEPGPGIQRGILHVAPRDLVARCVAGLGSAQPSWRNATTPALLFDGLRPVLVP